MKQIIILLAISLGVFNSYAQQCDTTFFYIKKELPQRTMGNEEHLTNVFSRVDKACFIQGLDSINKNNINQYLEFMSRYYSFQRKNIEDEIDSTLAARISYKLADTNLYIASRYNSYFINISKHRYWILEHNEQSRLALREYILNRKEVDRNMIHIACKIGDTVAFWYAYSIAKKSVDKGKAGREYFKMKYYIDIVCMGMDYFHYYDLFEEIFDDLIKMKQEWNLFRIITNSLPSYKGIDYARKLYNKVVLNKEFMKKEASTGDSDDISIFNFVFVNGIEIFYPELLNSREYKKFVEGEMNYFNEPLYNTLVRTIKNTK